ncbi:hypothetical protein CJ739_2357 [Mariniflexile rhizosphaerae]|uniref:DUF5683 domain-containing protein n=1 Tax=unclassified Mariniflexile TaxID=2643887 RepID=UPI000CC16F83|nr:DUF5683 domain-containing protein [Mariniflexile sp. TRM1-10]AXP81431.1 hypothetical protein CJ739_2357 [Mariniflexile sp. TRM1-10]PLB18466.1 MAG: hypothetical protein TRG1_2619 [Flavobacteriaceae bacterium FS1-H7996/R]
MPNKLFIASVFSLLFCCFLSAQEKNNKKKELPATITVDSIIEIKKPYNPLSPAKAAFYSAVLPGLGQAYNKRYWKIPIVYGGLATGIYFYTNNNKEYHRYRDAYKSRLAGFKTDEFYFDSQGNPLTTPRVTTDGLERGQKFYRKNKEISLLVTLGIYALNIIDANVDAHLMQYNVDENLSLAPHFKINEIDATSNLGLTLNFKF